MTNAKGLILKKFGKGFVLFFCWIIAPLVTVELAMIILDPYVSIGFYQYDPDMGFRVRSYVRQNALGELETNRFGFNAREYPLEKTPGKFRTLIIGDSFNWSGGRDGNYTALLEKKFNSIPGRPEVEVINAGYPMTHTGEQLTMLKKFGLLYSPDLVVLGFFAGNDFVDADPYRKRIVVNDTLMDIDRRHEIKVLGYPLVLKSRLLLFIEQKYTVFREAFKSKTEGKTEGSFSEDTFLSIEASRMNFCNINLFRAGVYQANIDYIFQSILEMSALLKQKNISLIVAIYPDEFQVNEALAKGIINKFKLSAEDYDLDLMQKVLKGFLEQQEIPYIDMLARFRKAGKTEILYIPRNTHWNQAGNRVAAEILYEDLFDTMVVK
jgi:hypothetical protein